MGLLKTVKHFFGIYTEAEQYQRGKDVVDSYLRDDPDAEGVADYLYKLAGGEFNRTACDAKFDEGVKDRLSELGFDS